MRKIFTPIVLLIFLVCFFTLPAQQGAKKVGKRVWLNLNAGSAWQNSDIKARPGAGLGLYLEVPIIENEKSFFGITARGRYLFTSTRGQNTERDYNIANNPQLNGATNNYTDYYHTNGYVFQNHRTTSGEFSGELAIYLNRFRAKTGVLLYGFGGVGINGFKVRTDQANGDDFFGYSQYDYSIIDGTSRRMILDQLYALRDAKYESIAGSPARRPSFVFAPAVGIGIGYQFTPGFRMGFEHKVTFTFTDSFDGLQGINKTWNGSNDLYHYTSAFLSFGIGGRHKKAKTQTNVNNYSIGRPSITAIYPSGNGVIAYGDCHVLIRAQVLNVSGINDISVRWNGMDVPSNILFWDRNRNELSFYMDLYPGLNTFDITARTSAGVAVRTLQITCNQTPPQTYPLPLIDVLYPSGGNYLGSNCRQMFRVKILYITRAEARGYYAIISNSLPTLAKAAMALFKCTRS